MLAYQTPPGCDCGAGRSRACGRCRTSHRGPSHSAACPEPRSPPCSPAWQHGCLPAGRLWDIRLKTAAVCQTDQTCALVTSGARNCESFSSSQISALVPSPLGNRAAASRTEEQRGSESGWCVRFKSWRWQSKEHKAESDPEREW